MPRLITAFRPFNTAESIPFFSADLSSDDTGYTPAADFGDRVDYNAIVGGNNIGGHFKTSGSDIGLFVAPVKGIHNFQCAAYSASSMTQMGQCWLVVNGNRESHCDEVHPSSPHSEASFFIEVNKGDKVGFHPYQNISGARTINANDHHTYFRGYLVKEL